MSRVRSPPREADRHTGDFWGRGAEYRFDEYVVLELGPWTHVTDREQVVNPKDALVNGGSLSIAPGGHLTVRTDFDETILGPDTRIWFSVHDLWLEDGARRTFFVATQSGNYVIRWTTGGDNSVTFTTSVASGAGNAPGKATVVPRGSVVYLTSHSKPVGYPNGIVKVETAAGSEAVTRILTAELEKADYIAELDNNLIVADNDPVGSQVRWSVDGDYEDFTGVGSGNNPMPASFGPIFGLAVISDICVILMHKGAMAMEPTGTLPAFRFRELHGINGCLAHGHYTHNKTTIFYIGHDGYLRASPGSQEIRVGSEPPLLYATSTVADLPNAQGFSYLEGMSLVLVRGWLVDTDSLEFVGKIDEVEVPQHRGAATSLDTAGGAGANLVLYVTHSVQGVDVFSIEDPLSAGSALVDNKFPVVNFGDEFELLYVDLVATQDIEDLFEDITVRMDVVQDDETVTTHTATLKEDFSTSQRWDVHVVGQVVQLRIETRTTVTDLGQGLLKVYLVGKYVSREGRSRIRV